MHFAVTAEVGDDREVAATAVDFTCKCYISVRIRLDSSVGSLNLRFSPVWLYMCVCNELGLVNLFSQTLHLCFFCVLDDTLELNEPIIDDGAGGMLPPISPVGRGKVRELMGSPISEAEL